jgi:ferritin
MEKALNAQVNKEFASAYLYLSMAAYFESVNLEGCAHWMRAQYQEENEHALKIFDYVNERGGRVKLMMLGAPETEWDSPLTAFVEAFHHERVVSKSIDQLVALSKQDSDNATFDFLQWFVDEQVEEEANVEQVIHDLQLVEKDPAGLLILDRELGKRE